MNCKSIVGLLNRIIRKSARTTSDTSRNNGKAQEVAKNVFPDGRFEVDTWVLSNFIEKKLLPVVGSRPYPLQELMLLSAATCRVWPSHIFEWGTNIGKSARIFYETARAFGLDTTVHSIDLPDDVSHVEHPGARRAHMVKGLDRVVLHQGDGLEVARQVIEQERASLGNCLFFLDGDHSYQSVSRELNGIFAIRPEASILVHDTFYQSDESGYNVGPHDSVEAFLKKHPECYQRIETQIGLPGMTLLFRQPGR